MSGAAASEPALVERDRGDRTRSPSKSLESARELLEVGSPPAVLRSSQREMAPERLLIVFDIRRVECRPDRTCQRLQTGIALQSHPQNSRPARLREGGNIGQPDVERLRGFGGAFERVRNSGDDAHVVLTEKGEGQMKLSRGRPGGAWQFAANLLDSSVNLGGQRLRNRPGDEKTQRVTSSSPIRFASSTSTRVCGEVSGRPGPSESQD